MESLLHFMKLSERNLICFHVLSSCRWWRRFQFNSIIYALHFFSCFRSFTFIWVPVRLKGRKLRTKLKKFKRLIFSRKFNSETAMKLFQGNQNLLKVKFQHCAPFILHCWPRNENFFPQSSDWASNFACINWKRLKYQFYSFSK